MVVRMLWWFLILGASAAVVVSVAVLLYAQVRRQMKKTVAGHKPQPDDLVEPSSPPEV
jgi:hypothetical protein